MKRVLSLVLALVMVLGMIPTFAAEMTGAEHLKEHGFISGGTDGDLMEANDLSREQLAAVMSQLYGVADQAAVFAQPADYPDSNLISAWAIPYVAYNQVNGWMQGNADGTFNPKGIVSAQQLSALLLKVLGYEVNWSTAIADASELGIELSGSKLTRGEAFEGIWAAVNTKLAGSDMTLGQDLGKLDPPAPVVTDLLIESVTATNLKEIVVKFNQAVDKDTVVATNFSLSPAAGTLSPVLGEDGMTVTITTQNAMTNQGAYKLTAEKVATASEVKLAKVVKDFTAFDATLPTVEEIIVTGPKTFDVVFSEPIVNPGSVTVKSANTTLAVQSNPATGTNKVTVTLYTSLADGTTYDVTVKDYEDAAGYKNVIKTISYTYAKDTTAPTVSLVSANQQYVVVEFNKPVTGLNLDNFYHTFSAWKPMGVYATKAAMDAGTPTITTASTNVTKVYVQFATTGASGQFPLQPGNVNVNVLGKVGSVEVKDNWGNALATTVLTANVVADLEAPTVTKVESTSNTNIAVTFSKAVNPGTTANYEVLKSDGTAISGLTFTVNAASATKVNLVLSKSLLGETVIVNVKNIEDTTLNKNKLVGTATNTITFADKEFAGVNRVEFDAANKLIYVVFNEAMNNTAIEIANYKLNDDGTVKSLTGPATFFSGNTVVKIELSTAEAALITAADKLLVSNAVKDLAGNGSVAFQTEVAIAAIGNVPPALKVITAVAQIKAIDKNTVTVQFDQELVAVDPTDFALSLDNGGTWAAPTAQALSTNSTGTLVTLTFAGTIPADVPQAGGTTVLVRGTFTAPGTVNVFGIAPTNFAGTVVIDKIAPTLVTKELTATNTIVLTYSEALNTSSVSLYTYTVAGNTVSAINPVGNQVTITLGTAVAANATPSVTQALAIEDLVGNKLDASTTAFTVADKIAPSMVSAVAKSANTVEITYSENVTNNNLAPTQYVFDIDGAGATAADVTSAVAVSGNKVTITLTTGGLTTGTAYAAATIVYTASATPANVTLDTATVPNAAATPQTITGVTSGF